MKQRTIDLIKRRTAVIAVAGAVLILTLAALAFRNSSGHSASPERPVSQADLYTALNDPKRSGLDPKLAGRLAALGTKVVRGDVTGVGRDAYPDYWAGGQYRPCCQSITIHAAGARHSGADPGAIDVIVIWSAQRLNNGPALNDQTETITFRQLGSEWRPVHPQNLTP